MNTVAPPPEATDATATPRAEQRIRKLRVALAGSIAISLLGLPHLAGAGESAAGWIIEATLLGLGLGLAVAASLRGLGAPPSRLLASRTARAAAVLLTLVVAGQLIRSKKTYPFMPYRMYGGAQEGPVSLLIYTAHHRSGQDRPFRISQVNGNLGAARGARGLKKRLWNLPEHPGLLEEQALTEAQKLGVEALRALMQLHNAKHPEDPITAVAIDRVVIPPPFVADAQTRTSLGRVELDAP